MHKSPDVEGATIYMRFNYWYTVGASTHMELATS